MKARIDEVVARRAAIKMAKLEQGRAHPAASLVGIGQRSKPLPSYARIAWQTGGVIVIGALMIVFADEVLPWLLP
jgi:hypothetical protein